MHLYDNDFEVILGTNLLTPEGSYPISIPSNIGTWRAIKCSNESGCTEALTLEKCSERTNDEMYRYWSKRNVTDEVLKDAQ